MIRERGAEGKRRRKQLMKVYRQTGHKMGFLDQKRREKQNKRASVIKKDIWGKHPPTQLYPIFMPPIW